MGKNVSYQLGAAAAEPDVSHKQSGLLFAQGFRQNIVAAQVVTFNLDFRIHLVPDIHGLGNFGRVGVDDDRTFLFGGGLDGGPVLGLRIVRPQLVVLEPLFLGVRPLTVIFLTAGPESRAAQNQHYHRQNQKSFHNFLLGIEK